MPRQLGRKSSRRRRQTNPYPIAWASNVVHDKDWKKELHKTIADKTHQLAVMATKTALDNARKARDDV